MRLLFPLLLLLGAISIDGIISRGLNASSWRRGRCGPSDLTTRWTAGVTPLTPALTEYPRPLLVRPAPAAWASLHGLWEWEQAAGPAPPRFNTSLSGSILVPFPPEACLSGLGVFSSNPSPVYEWTWARLVLDAPFNTQAPGVTLLHLDACDWNCTAWLNGVQVVSHLGGYSRITVDVSAHLRASNNELLVFAHDPTERGAQPQGKQLTKDPWVPGTLGEKYVSASGIWGPVWLERLPTFHISAFTTRSNASCASILVVVRGGGGDGAATVNVSATLRGGGSSGWSVGVAGLPVMLCPAHPMSWAPGSPWLYDAAIEVVDNASGARDSAQSYFALRSIAVERYIRPDTPASGPLPNASLGGAGSLGTLVLPHAEPSLCADACSAWATSHGANCTVWIYAPPGCGGGGPRCTIKGQVGLPLVPGGCTLAGRAAIAGGPASRPTLNGAPLRAAGWLDQRWVGGEGRGLGRCCKHSRAPTCTLPPFLTRSWFPDGGMTPPSAAAAVGDIAAAVALGFNAVRAHTKVMSPWFYAAADAAGVVVWQDAVQKFCGEGTPCTSAATVPLFTADLESAVKDVGSHACIVTWVLFNEGDCVSLFNASEIFGLLDALDGAASPHGAQGMGRLIDFNSGGPGNALGLGDAFDVHSYPYPATPLPSATQFAMVGEWSGMGWFPGAGHEWDLGTCYTGGPKPPGEPSPAALASAYAGALDALTNGAPWVSAAIATQATDVEAECDGLYNYDRTSKFDDAAGTIVREANKRFIAGGGGKG